MFVVVIMGENIYRWKFLIWYSRRGLLSYKVFCICLVFRRTPFSFCNALIEIDVPYLYQACRVAVSGVAWISLVLY